MRRCLALLGVLALLAGACTTGEEEAEPSGTGSTPSATAEPTGFPSPIAGIFGTLSDVKLVSDTPAYTGDSTPHSLTTVRIAAAIEQQLSPAATSMLESNGFAVVPSDLRLFTQAYGSASYDQAPVYVTTDVAYHMWHLVFDKVLRDLEQEVFLPKLEELVTGLLEGARAQSRELSGTPLADAADRVEQLFQTAGSVLELDVGTLGPLAQQELALIREHAVLRSSPIVGTGGACAAPPSPCVDYSLYTPRGHYTRTPELTRYFLGMSVLGQTAFSVGGQDATPLRVGILATRVLLGNERLTELWRDIYEPTAFLVGLADDYTPAELAAGIAKVAPGGLQDPSAFAQDARVSEVVAELARSRPVRIDPENPSVRIMGVRFVVDSYVLDQLIYPNVGTEDNMRLIPSPLDLAAAFGSEFAYGIQKEAGETDYANYDDQMDRMRAEIAARGTNEWGSTVYDAWLWAIQPMWVPHGAAFPDYMQTEAWKAKDHQSGLGSYSELKHDTILYTKQAAAEGEGQMLDPSIRNWVEPDPVPFARLASLTSLMREGLWTRNLSTRVQDRLMADAAKMLQRFAWIASDELAGKPMSVPDNTWLAFIGGIFEGLWWRTADVEKGGVSSMDQDAAIIADIARGGDQVVEVATGRIDWIFVIVPGMDGGWEIARGGVYSYYEFLQPVSERLNDEQWRKMLDDGSAPDRPAWEEAILAT
ncbi:MAG: DUF3160 domain-containing protein [Actinomycetota bacterium]